jgi:hypothetical protein
MSPQSQSPSSDRTGTTLCSNCLSAVPEVFYRCKQIPVHCLQLVESHEAAVNHARHDLNLGICRECGFITNVSFDASVLKYDENADSYEESQGCSPTFRKFSERLAKRFVDDYKLKGLTGVEIGCGKGGFLVDLIRSGVGRGIGYDPAYTPGRLDSSALDRLEFRREFFTEQTSPLAVDFFCCRHTLEHIPETLKFLRNVRQNIGDRLGTPLFIEVPDATRILTECAFWDIFYEHCSYFNRTPLESAFRHAGFEVEDSWLDYDDQYLMVVGRAVAAPYPSWQPKEEEMDTLDSVRKEFEQTVTKCITSHQTRISSYAERGMKVAIWGSGSKCVGYLATLGPVATSQVDCVVDISTFRQGYYMPGVPHKILAPSELVERRPDAVIVMNPIYVAEITADLHKMGLHPEIVTV